MAAFIAENWPTLLAAVVALIGGGLAWRWHSHRQNGSSAFADQRNAQAGGDIVGRDKVSNRDQIN